MDSQRNASLLKAGAAVYLMLAVQVRLAQKSNVIVAANPDSLSRSLFTRRPISEETNHYVWMSCL